MWLDSTVDEGLNSKSDCETLSEEDLALIHALQLHPRATWTDLTPVLGTSAATLARRWKRLRSEGYAWVTSYPLIREAGIKIALAEVDCVPGRINDVAETLEIEPTVIGVDQAAHGRDLIVTVGGNSFRQLTQLLLDGLAQTPGVSSVRTHLMGRVHLERDEWTLDALDPGQIAQVHALRSAEFEPRGGSVDIYGPIYGPIVRLLVTDGRATAAEIAGVLNRPASTTRRQLTTLLRSGMLAFRCEVAQMLTRWPICVAWWLRLPTGQIDTAVQRIRYNARVRYCVSLTGPANLLIAAWTSDVSEVVAMQNEFERDLPYAEVMDTTVVLRTRKLMGWLLHPDGRCIGPASDYQNGERR